MRNFFADLKLEKLLDTPPARDRNGRSIYISTQLAGKNTPDHPACEVIAVETSPLGKPALVLRYLFSSPDEKNTILLQCDCLPDTNWVVCTKPNNEDKHAE